jgi:PAS domain S-box-containing protein
MRLQPDSAPGDDPGGPGADPGDPAGQPPDSLRDQIQACMMQRQNLEAIFNSVADGIMALDLSQRISNVNDAAQQILGYPRQKCVGESCTLTLGLDPGSDFCTALTQRRELDGLSIRIQDGGGQARQLVASTRVLQDGTGLEQGMVVILRDVTELEALRGRLQERKEFGRLIGRSQLMQGIYRLIEDLADSDATILLLGETGTGKELVTEAIHATSRRRSGQLVKVNCSALSEGVLESELFGHVKGAFTGAVRDKIGRFEQASGGTLFLDEIGDLSAAVQVKLLRALQEREIERVGSGATVQVDVRVIAATHRDLRAAIRAGQFREDLFYRLNVMPMEMPPLRRRREDIPLLVGHFVERFNQRLDRRIEHLDDAALGRLMEHDWPGNVRELENAIEHAFIRCRGGVLLPECLPALETAPALGVAPAPGGDPERQQHAAVDPSPGTSGQRPTSASAGAAGLAPTPRGPATEREQVLEVLQACRWNRTEAATRLNMHRTTLWRKLREWGLTDVDAK